MHTDHLGSTTLLTGQSGQEVACRGYTPFGATRYPTDSLPTDRLYTGQRWDAALALYDYRARWYDPALRRFVSADTVVSQPGNPQALNRYAYVTNNPLNFTDPTGHYVFEGEYCVGPGCDYDPTSARYQLPVAGGTINADTYFLSPAVSEDIFGVAVAQRVSQGTVGALNDPNNLAMPLIAFGGGFMAGLAGMAMPVATTQVHIPSPLFQDAYGDPGPGALLDCPCGVDTIPEGALVNFARWRAERTVLSEGDVLYRVHSPGRAYGSWWTRTRPVSEIQWRIDQAVRPEWNSAEEISVLIIPPSQNLVAWEGSAAYQGDFYVGGGNQLYLPVVPQTWVTTVSFTDFVR